ncbi:MAG: hypothetical protein F6K50_35830 [Moorea sp. SIO3I7]|nr:hypothetical protein [Moorena sp. SIO3I7]
MKKKSYTVTFPNTDENLIRAEEYFILTENDQEQKLRIQDYKQTYKIPGLYEYVLVDLLKYNTHNIISDILINEVTKSQSLASELSVLDLAAGVGLLGQCLKDKGVTSIVGADVVIEAAEAAKRERPNVYNKYYVEEFPNVTNEVHNELENAKFNCLVCASALTGGLPASGFAFAYNLIVDGGWIAFNIKEDLLDTQSQHNGGKMLATIIKEGILSVKAKQSYQHRLSVNGNSLNELALIGVKISDIPQTMISSD